MEESIPTYILAGGRSRRYGSDKARIPMGGQPLLLRIARELAAIASAVSVVARSTDAYDDLGLRTLADSVQDQGPLGGLLTALEDAGPTAWIFLAACDLMGIRISWARTLLEARREDVSAVVFRSDRYHPLFALYHGRSAGEVRQSIHAGDLKMQHLFDRVPSAVLPVPEDWDQLVNRNRPRDQEPRGG